MNIKINFFWLSTFQCTLVALNTFVPVTLDKLLFNPNVLLLFHLKLEHLLLLFNIKFSLLLEESFPPLIELNFFVIDILRVI